MLKEAVIKNELVKYKDQAEKMAANTASIISGGIDRNNIMPKSRCQYIHIRNRQELCRTLKQISILSL